MSSPETIGTMHLSLAEAYAFVESQCEGVSRKAKNELRAFLAELAGESMVLSGEQALQALETFKKVLVSGDHSPLLEKRGIRWKKIADVQEFVESKFFLNLRGKVWPAIMEDLWAIFHGEDSHTIQEVVIGGAIGSGKSYQSELMLNYLLYQLSCYHSPQLEFSLAPGSNIYLVCQSISLEKAKKVLFEQLCARLCESEYFTKYFYYDKSITSELKFPNNVNVMPVASGDNSALGFNVFGIFIDECNFMGVIQNSVKSRITGKQEYDQADTLYQLITRRIKSRFMHKGHYPGKIILASSANYPDDFIDRRMKEAREAEQKGGPKTIYTICRSQWDARPPGTFLEEKFLVEIGDAARRSRIISAREEAVDPESVIEVPVDFLSDFQKDIEASLRDIAGIPVGGVDSFIRQREKLAAATTRHALKADGQQLFTVGIVDLSRINDASFLLNEKYVEELADPLAEYSLHLDLALTGDHAGIAVGHNGGMVQVGKSYDWDERERKYVEVPPMLKPSIFVDGLLEIVPPMNDEIDINMIGDIVEAIASRLNLVQVSADTYQSAALLQRLRKYVNCKGRRIRSGTLSVDTSLAPYALTKQALRDDRLDYPEHDTATRELRDLQFDKQKGKVDHPSGGGKDVSDALAGVAYLVSNQNGGKALRQKGEGVRRIRTGRKRLH